LRPVELVIASYLEPVHVERIRAIPGVRVTYEPALLPRPRYPNDHVGAPLRRSPGDEARWRQYLMRAEVLFDFDYTNLADLAALIPHVRWLQATSTGIGQLLLRTGLITTAITFTTARGIHARPLADFVAMAILWFAKDGFRMMREQTARRWVRYCGRDVAGATVGLIGYGSIGREVARICRALGMTVLATSRSAAIEHDPAGAHRIVPLAALPELLGQADYLVLAVPHTPETEGLLGRAQFAALKPGAVLINVARGAVIDERALIEALRSGRLGGAALDVLASEPPEPDHPLWTMPNVLLSPHSASTVASENARLTDLFCENLRRYLEGEPLLNVFDRQRLY
jgi:glyoxylate/hydroxypyruvate reductase A